MRPRRTGRIVAVALLLLLTAQAAAQRVKLDRGGTVQFAPSGDELAAALGCAPASCIAPTLSSPDIELSILRQNPRNDNDLQLVLGPWSFDAGVELFVQLELDGNRSPPVLTDWLPLSSGPLDVTVPDDPRVDVRVFFRMRPLGGVAGAGSATLHYRVGGSSVAHAIALGLPVVTMLRIRGSAPGIAASLAFDYAPDPLSYLNAVENGTPLPVTDGSLEAVEVFSTSPGGWRVEVTLVQLSPGPGLPDGAIRLGGQPADGLVLRGNGPTNGFETLLVPADYTLVVTGAEATGNFVYQLDFRAGSLP